MYERVRQEIDLLKQKYPQVQHGEQLNWVFIPDYPLPDGYNKENTRLLWNLPAGYPETASDDFFVDGDLRQKDGSNPPNMNIGPIASSGLAPIVGNWAWFSWHPDVWRPAANIAEGDNLLSFLRAVNMCLRGEGK